MQHLALAGSINLLAGGPTIIGWIVLGGLAGTVAGRTLYGRAFGFLGNIILGIIGGLVGGEVLGLFVDSKQSFYFWGSLLIAILGSFLVVWIWGTITGKKRSNA